MPKISKEFRSAVEGETVDGRRIERHHIQEMADSYNPSVYGARVNLEHYVSSFPNSVFRCYGDVQSARAEEITEGALAGKLALNVVVKAEDDLVDLLSTNQKIYPSVEYFSKFAATGKAYLVGLGFTDTPASLGTEIMRFNRLPQEHLFSIGDEVTIEFEEEASNKPSVFTRVKEMFSASNHKHDERFSEIEKAIELIAEQQQGIADSVETLTTQTGKANKQELDALRTDLDTLKTTLSNTDEGGAQRQPSTGAPTYSRTDC